MMKKILILGVAAVQYDAIKLLTENFEDVQIHAAAMKNDGPGANKADKFVEINILDIDSIKEYVYDNSIDLVYSVGSDLSMPVSASISEQIGLPHFVSSTVAKICNNKDLMRNKLEAMDQGTVRYQSIEDLAEFNQDIVGEFPMILKPADSQGQRGVVKVQSFDDLKRNFSHTKSYSRSGKVILEKYIRGAEVSVNGYMVNGVLKFCAISDRETWPKYEGLIHKHILPADVNETVNKKIKNLLQEVCSIIEIKNGPVYAQMKIEDDIPYIIEVTPRLDGCHMWKLIKEVYELNLLKLTFNHLLYEDISELNNFKEKNIRMTLDFHCQEPNTPANYPIDYQETSNNNTNIFKYYLDNQLIRPINGKFEKIGYKIY